MESGTRTANRDAGVANAFSASPMFPSPEAAAEALRAWEELHPEVRKWLLSLANKL